MLLLGLTIVCAVFAFSQNRFLQDHPSITDHGGKDGLISLLFLILPGGSLWQKIRSLISSQNNQEALRGINPLADRMRGLSVAPDQETARQLLRKTVKEWLNPNYLHFYLYDPRGGGYHRADNPNKKGVLPGYISPESHLPAQLAQSAALMLVQPGHLNPQMIDPWPLTQGDRNYALLAPFSSSSGLLGWLEIGPPMEDAGNQHSKLQAVSYFLDAFSANYAKLEFTQQDQEQLAITDVRDQILQTLLNSDSLDHFIQQLYTYLQQTLAIQDLSLILQDPDATSFRRVISIHDGASTISSNNPQPLEPNALEREAIAMGQVSRVESQGSWLIAPLLSNDHIIGAIRLGNQDNNEVIKTVDSGFLQFIASSVSAAVKIHQLKGVSLRQKELLDVYNQVSEQLTLTMHLDSLLVNILDAALKTLNGSSGILMVMDETRGELISQVTAGPITAGLKGERLPSNAGIAGEAYTHHHAVIKNQVKLEPSWLKNMPPETAVQVQNILAVPMIAHGKVIGVLELINKNNGRPFVETDQKILQNFANQAAVAVHHASRHSATDQALEVRVEELYIMQQIDRDLNASQDIDHALQQMLEAALQYTTAKCGTIGLVDCSDETFENIWQISLDHEQDSPYPLEDTGLSQETWFSPGKFDTALLSREQISASLRFPETRPWHYLTFSELNEERGLLLALHTDSPDHLSQNHKAFLSRLIDHGIIALKNALLYQELHEAVQTKNEFISFISHELKNPLTVIKGYADILRKGMAGQVNEEQIDYLSTINHNVRRMNTFITDLSDQAHIETKSLRLDFEPTPVHEVISEVLHSYEAQIEKKSLHIDLHLAGDIPDIWCDRMRLIQILANLISNAIKYSPEARTILIGAEQAVNLWDEQGAAEVVHLWVQDQGYGIAPDDQVHLFEKFYRGTDLRIKKIPGTGLGLRISKSLVEMMGGKMWFESIIDEGSTFHFTMPI